jgi:hypothetical protein
MFNYVTKFCRWTGEWRWRLESRGEEGDSSDAAGVKGDWQELGRLIVSSSALYDGVRLWSGPGKQVVWDEGKTQSSL